MIFKKSFQRMAELIMLGKKIKTLTEARRIKEKKLN